MTAALLVASNATIWFVASTVQSPAQVAASARPPRPSVITAPVESKLLVDSLVFRVDIGPSDPINLSVPAGQGDSSPVVTDVRKQPGETVQEGDVLVAVSGRPVVLLQGALPSYRDLLPGSSGPDVSQFQDALRRLGIPDSDSRGSFGASTQQAVQAFYNRIGFQAPLTSPDANQQRQNAANAVATALAQLQSAKAQLASAQLAAAQGNGSSTDVAVQQAAVASAMTALSSARDNEATVDATTGVMVPRSEIAYSPEVPVVVTSSTAVVGQAPDQPFMTISGSNLIGTGSLTSDQAQQLHPGVPVTIDTSGTPVAAQVTSVASEPTSTNGVAGFPVVVSGVKPLPVALLGSDLKATAQVQSTAGPVLAVPESALVSDASGTVHVTVVAADGRQLPVTVGVGLVAGGWAEVRPDPGLLRPGENVVVGVR